MGELHGGLHGKREEDEQGDLVITSYSGSRRRSRDNRRSVRPPQKTFPCKMIDLDSCLIYFDMIPKHPAYVSPLASFLPALLRRPSWQPSSTVQALTPSHAVAGRNSETSVLTPDDDG